MDLKRFRTKSVIVTAEQWFPGKAIEGVEVEFDANQPAPDVVARVRTHSGLMRIQPGEWIITSTGGGKWPYTPEAFEEMYEPVETSSVEPTDLDGYIPDFEMRRFMSSVVGNPIIAAESIPEKLELSEQHFPRHSAAETLQQIQEIIQASVAGNPLVTVEKIPEWLVGFLIASKSADDERLAEIKSLTRELWLANEKLRAGGAVEEEDAPVFSTYAQLDAAVDEIAEAAREYEEFKKKETEGLLIGGSEGQVLDSTGEYRDATADELAEAARDYDAWRSKT
jgi:hypothetical protein